MKPILPLLAGAAVIAAAFSSWSPVAHAQQPAGQVGENSPLLYPVGRRCVITLDPQDPGKKREGQANADNYRVLDNKLEGELLWVGPEWLVLKDGKYENWIPRDKILAMRVSR